MSFRRQLFQHLLLISEIFFLIMLAGLQATGGTVAPQLVAPVLLTIVALAIVTIDILRNHPSVIHAARIWLRSIRKVTLTRSVRSQITDPLII